MLIALISPARRLPATVVASRLKLFTCNARPQRRCLNLLQHSKSKWKTLPWDQTVYLRLLKEHKQAVERKDYTVAWGLPLMPFVFTRGTVVHAANLQHYVILLDRVSISVRLDDQKQEPVLTVDVFMLTSSMGYDNNRFRMWWSHLDTEPLLNDADVWNLYPRSEYDVRPEENPNLPLTKVSRLFQKEYSRPVMETGALTIPIKYLDSPVPHRWFSLTRESIDRLDPFTEHGLSTREFLAFCPAFGAPGVGLTDAYYHGHQEIYLPTGRWPFQDRTAVVFSRLEDTEEEKVRMVTAAKVLAHKFVEMGRVRTAKVKQLWLDEIISKALPRADYHKYPTPKTIALCALRIARALEKWRGTTIMIHVPRNMPQIPVQLLFKQVLTNMKGDTAVIVALMGRKLYGRIFDHESEQVRETFATEIVFKPPLKPAPVLTEPAPETTTQEDEMFKRLMEKFHSQHEQRIIREREEAEKARRKEERERQLAEAARQEEEKRQAKIQHEMELQKEAEKRRVAAERKELQIQKDVEGWYEAAVQYEIDASLRKEEESVIGATTQAEQTVYPSVEDAENEIEEAQLSEGSINIKDGAICIGKEGSITVMDGFLNKRDGSIIIKTGFVNMESGDIDFLRRDDRSRFQEDLSKLSISFEDGVSHPGGEGASDEGFDVDSGVDDAESNPDLIGLTEAEIKIADGYIEIEDGSIKVIGEEGFDDAKKILSSIRIKRGAIHIISGSASFKDGKDGFINCSFDISESTLAFKDGYSDIKVDDDSAVYSVRHWGTGYVPQIDRDNYSYGRWSYEPLVEIRDTARERIRKRQEEVARTARREWELEEEERLRNERERLRNEQLAQRRAAMLKGLSMSFVTDKKRKKKD
ncbi:hypothetical protein QBC41DRAFT_263386 [Cercophora samala]|uniref:Uncharacterized protein n=1 Tax=Cercophora samala TaxID=330535 RepID=A0AA40CYU1_9PEZI|nr:hypothetical protein QBC41DRAFT_263386 [Cercophora samala]